MDVRGAPGTLILANSGAETFGNVLEFFSAGIRNFHTRKAYYRAVSHFMGWAEIHGVETFQDVRPIHVACWVESLCTTHSVATVKQHLAGLSMLLDWLVVRHLIAVNPAASVKSPREIITKGKTPVLDPTEARQLLDCIDTTRAIGLRDRAMIGLMLYSFARIGAVLNMRVSDVFVQSRRMWIRLNEKGGKVLDLPCHHELEEILDAYIRFAGISEDGDGYLIRAIDRVTGLTSQRPLASANAYQRVKLHARNAGIETQISNHTFRATGITAYLSNHGTLEIAARMANHSSTRTTQLYDRRSDVIAQAEVERIRF